VCFGAEDSAATEPTITITGKCLLGTDVDEFLSPEKFWGELNNQAAGIF
jgi:hypothetical protein